MVRPLTRRRILRNITALLSGSMVSQGINALTLLLIARQLGPAGYGQYAACFALAGFAAILINLGADIWLLREGGRQAAPLSESLGSVLAVKVVAGIAWLGLILVVAPLLRQDTFPAGLLQLSAFSVLLDSLFATALTAFKASLRNHVTSLLESASDATWLMTTLLLIGLRVQQVETYVQVRIIVLFISLLVAIFIIWRTIGIRGTFRTVRRLVREAPPFAASELLSWISLRMDVLIIAFALGEHAAGLYAPAVSIVNALFLVPAAVHGVMVPVLSHLVMTNTAQAEVTAKRMVILLLATGLGLSLTLMGGAPLLVSFLKESFSGSLSVLRILSAILLFKSGSFAMAAILVAIGRQPHRALVQAVAAIANIGLNLWIVYRLGIEGVAWVYVLTELLTVLGYTWLVQRYRPRSVAYSMVK